MKSKVKTIIILIMAIILCLGVGTYAGYALSAGDVTYTKPGTTTEISVKEALDELNAKETANDELVASSKAVGDEVRLGGEQFYVLEWNSGSYEATLMAKYNLNTSGSAQQNDTYGTTRCAFSSSAYWSSSYTGSPLGLNNFSGYSSKDAIGKAKSYGNKKGAIASGLLSYGEALELKSKESSDTKIAKMLWGKDSTDGYLYYWLGSANGPDSVWKVVGLGSYLSYTDYDRMNDGCGVRPVITVLKSKIS